MLHVACRYAQTETVRYLTGLHVNVDAQDKNLDTALHIACWQGSARIVQVLLKAGAGSSSRLLKNEDGETALHVASSRGNLDCVRCLIANGGGENSKLGLDDPDKWGNTALHLAIRRRYSQVAMLLLHAGAEFDLRNCVSFVELTRRFIRISASYFLLFSLGTPRSTLPAARAS